MRICSPHCGVAPETTSGGETYERELLARLGRAGVDVELILARGKPHPEGVPHWTVHRFPIRRTSTLCSPPPPRFTAIISRVSLLLSTLVNAPEFCH